MGFMRDVREALKSTKRRPPSKIYCPRCGSAAIHTSFRNDIFLVTKQYVCDDCKYSGPLIMELEKEKE